MVNTDLMVGDFVFDKDSNIIQIQEIMQELITSNDVNYQISELNPIPITEEFLYKQCEHVHCNTSGGYYGITDVIVITHIDEKFKFGIIELKYVHELQHLYRLLNLDKQIQL